MSEDYIIMKKEDWDYFLSKVNFGASGLDAKAIRIMNEVKTEKRVNP